MHHGGASSRRAPARGQVKEVISVGPVEADHDMAQALQMSRDRGTHMTAMPSDQNAHNPMIGQGRKAAGPGVRFSPLAAKSRLDRLPWGPAPVLRAGPPRR